MSNGITDLSVLHEVPYSDIKGASVKVLLEKDDPMMLEARTEREVRQGTIVGRGNGQGVAYDRQEKDCKPISIGPSIYLETPEDTILEVRTEKVANKLLNYKDNE